MPEITISMAAGRTDEQKAGMMRDITQALVKNARPLSSARRCRTNSARNRSACKSPASSFRGARSANPESRDSQICKLHIFARFTRGPE